MRRLELRVPPVAVALVTIASMWLISVAAPSCGWHLAYGYLIAVALVSAGGLAGVLGIMAFRRSRTTLNPTKPHTASALVTCGIYRTTRNPMYLGLLLVLSGLAVLLSNAAALAALPLFVVYMNRFQISVEERALVAIFGDEFRNYMQQVRRWI